MTWGIYGLIDPRNGKIMYVGKATDIERRYKQHCNSWKNFDGNIEKYNWIHELRKLGLVPDLKILRVVPRYAYAELDQAEKEVLREMKAAGLAELNITNGGASRVADRALNGSQDDWIALGEFLRRIRADIISAAEMAGRLGGAKYVDEMLRAIRFVDKTRSKLEDLLLRKFPEWEGLARNFYRGE